MAGLIRPEFREAERRLQLWSGRWGIRDQGHQNPSVGFLTRGALPAHSIPWLSSLPFSGTIPPIKSAQGEGDDVKKLFTIGCPVILATLGAALLFVVRKKRKEKRLKRLRGEGLFFQLSGTEGGNSHPPCHHSVGHRTAWARDQSLCPLKGRPATQSFLSLLSHSQFSPFMAPGFCAYTNKGWHLYRSTLVKPYWLLTYANSSISLANTSL